MDTIFTSRTVIKYFWVDEQTVAASVSDPDISGFGQFGEDLLAQRSTRYFVSFGIDIVVKRFY